MPRLSSQHTPAGFQSEQNGSPDSTQQYAKVTPATLTKAYHDAG